METSRLETIPKGTIPPTGAIGKSWFRLGRSLRGLLLAVTVWSL
ncbi:MAG: hypothetical protein QNJ72_32605 [Pleurocapsa sp. MO_226.B13]|nr:hypothetical protein [Pleurocapsa sp. MO_226.B13]